VQKFADDAPLLVEGQRLFEQVRRTELSFSQRLREYSKIAPSLLKISAKVDPSWMVRWIENPHKFRPRTRMPNFDLKEDDALGSLRTFGPSPGEGDKWTQGASCSRRLARGDAERRCKRPKKLVETIGCKGCAWFCDGEFTIHSANPRT